MKTSIEHINKEGGRKAISCNYKVSEDMMLEVLSRLPVKSLMRFKSVCQNWNNLMKNSSFVNKHLHQHNTPSHVLVQHYSLNTDKFNLSLLSSETLNDISTEYYDLDEIQMPRLKRVLIGPCDGIIGFLDTRDEEKERIGLWNPATKEFQALSLPYPNNLFLSFRAYIHLFGIGLDLVTGNYKVVCIRSFWDEETDNPYFPRVINVYTLGINSWRVFEVKLRPATDICDSLCNTCVNGVCYWLTNGRRHPDLDIYEYGILSFDLSNETFQETTGLPDVPDSKTGFLTMYGDSIALLVRESEEEDGRMFEVWLMKELELWTKQLRIGPILGVQRPLVIWKNNKLFVKGKTSNLLLCDLRTQEVQDLGFGCGGKETYLGVVIYMESLVSIRGENEWQEGNDSNFHIREPNLNMVQIQDFLAR